MACRQRSIHPLRSFISLLDPLIYFINELGKLNFIFPQWRILELDHGPRHVVAFRIFFSLNLENILIRGEEVIIFYLPSCFQFSIVFVQSLVLGIRRLLRQRCFLYLFFLFVWLEDLDCFPGGSFPFDIPHWRLCGDDRWLVVRLFLYRFAGPSPISSLEQISPRSLVVHLPEGVLRLFFLIGFQNFLE